MADDRVEIDPLGLPASVAQTTAAAAAAGLTTGRGGLTAMTLGSGGGVDALTAEIAATIATWSPQSEVIAADLAAGGTHLGQRTAATSTGLTDTDHNSGGHIDAITT